ncbi:hypothetical protein [Thermovibrio sp.]
MKEKLLNLIIVISVVVIVTSLFVLYLFNNPSVITKRIKVKEVERLPVGQVFGNLTEEGNKTQGGIPQEVLNRIEDLKSVIPTYIFYLKCGIEKRPAVILKAQQTEKGTDLYLLTLYPLEWSYTKADLKSYGTFKVKNAYVCKGGTVAVELNLPGLFPPEVERGKVSKYGVVVNYNGKELSFSPFEEGNCTVNGFVFNLAGELAGVCFGGNFIESEELYREVPKECRPIYREEKGDGNIQG